MADNKPQNIPQYWPTTSIAQLLGITKQRVGQLDHDGVFKSVPIQEKKCYHVVETTQAYINYVKRSGGGSADDAANASKKLAAEAEIKELSRQKAALLLDELKGILHRDEDVKAVLCDLVYQVKAELAGFRNKAAVELCDITDPAVMGTVLDKYLDDIQTNLSKWQYDPGTQTAKQSRQRRAKELRSAGEVDG